MHLIALHEHGSSNPLGVTGNIDRLPFSPYFVFKDLVTVFVFLLIYSSFVFFNPNTLGQRMALIIVPIISHCAICRKDSPIYNKTIIIRGLYLKTKNHNLYYEFFEKALNCVKDTKALLFKYYANPYLVKSYYKESNLQITKIIFLL
jgi:ubiquinol-cytochrome c reductase cytochrome b subunit